MTKSQVKDILRHGGKALLCSLQLFILNALTRRWVTFAIEEHLSLRYLLSKQQEALIGLIHPLITIILFVVFWRYYDNNDDRSFDKFCEAPTCPRLLRSPEYLTGLALTVLTATPTLYSSLYLPLARVGLGVSLSAPVSCFLAMTVSAGFSVVRLTRLEEVWRVQKDLRISKKSKTKPVLRIFYAIVLFFSIYLLIKLGFQEFLPLWGSLLYAICTVILPRVLPFLLLLIVPVIVITPICRFASRRKFMKRLKKLQDEGEITYTIHGHPYLSVLFPKWAHFGLNVMDAPHADAKRKEYRAYTVGFINCPYRKGTVILCDRNIYRFMYAIQMRGLSFFGTGGVATVSSRIVAVPIGAWYTNHAFDFPEGDGEKILIIDPAPRILAIHGRTRDELVPLDNDSHVFGYTVYGRNAFLRHLKLT